MNRKTKIVVAAVAVIAIAAIAFFGIRNRMHKPTDARNVIKIGAILPLTGNLAFAGESCRDGALLAVEQFNQESSRVKIQISFEDSKGTTKNSISAYQKIRNKNDTSILFCATSVTAKAVVGFSPSELTLMALVSDSNITLGNKNIFNLTVNANQEIKSIFDFWIRRGVRKIAVIYQKDELGQETKDVIQKFSRDNKILIADEEEVTDSTSISQGVIRTVSAKPDAIFIATVGSNAATIAKKLKELNFQGIVCSFKGFYSPSVINQAGVASNGIYICFTPYDVDFEHASENLQFFRREYSNRFGRAPDFMAAYSYCIVNITLRAYQKADFNIEKTKDILSKTNGEPSIFGEISCDSNRIFVFPIEIGIIQDGNIERIDFAHEKNIKQ